MAGISTSGLGLPSAASLFAATGTPGAPTTTAPTTSVAVDPTSQQPGILVEGPAGSTALPPAAPADFAGEGPTPLDTPHPQYPTLIKSHVAVLQAIGTPEAVIADLARQQPQAEWLDGYIQDDIMRYPEGWDEYVGNPPGTARAGLQQLLGTPAVEAAAAEPATAPASEGSGLVKGLLIGAAAVGVGVLGWMFLKNRNAAEPARQAVQAMAGGGDDAAAAIAGGGALGAFAHNATSVSASTSAAATAESIRNGMGAANGFINSAGISALHFDMPMGQAINAALADRYMGVLEMATKSGQLGDFAATQVAMRQALTGSVQAAETVGTAAVGNASLRALLAQAANAIPV